MSYDGQETSVQAGQPVELYRFSNASAETFFYTSGQQAVTYDNETYEPLPIRRTRSEIGETGGDAGGLTIAMPIGNEFAQRYSVSVPPARDNLTIFRFHTTDVAVEVVTIFEGYVASVAVQGDESLVKARPTNALLDRTMPRRTFQGPCPHVLYDRGCKVSDLDPSFRFAVSVDAISSDGLTVTVSGTGISGMAADFFHAGFLRRATVEHRMVLASVDLTGDVLELSVLLPFQVLSVGDALELYAGCDHSLATCASKFNNAVNYGGFPFVPTRNPFETGIVI